MTVIQLRSSMADPMFMIKNTMSTQKQYISKPALQSAGTLQEVKRHIERVAVPLRKSRLKYRLHHRVQLSHDLLAVRRMLLELRLDRRLGYALLQTHREVRNTRP